MEIKGIIDFVFSLIVVILALAAIVLVYKKKENKGEGCLSIVVLTILTICLFVAIRISFIAWSIHFCTLQ